MKPVLVMGDYLNIYFEKSNLAKKKTKSLKLASIGCSLLSNSSIIIIKKGKYVGFKRAL